MGKTCTACHETKPLSEFHHRRNSRRPEKGLYPIGRCKPCERARMRRVRRGLRSKAGTVYARDVVRRGLDAAVARACSKMARRYMRELREVLPATTAPPGPSPVAECMRCARVYVPTTKRQRYYSKECNWRAQRSKRRARIKAAFVENVDLYDIYQRDGGVCQLCGERVDRRCRYPSPRTPVLDHIVPLSRGGKHERRNVQLAHHGCNNSKNARAAGSQLRCVG